MHSNQLQKLARMEVGTIVYLIHKLPLPATVVKRMIDNNQYIPQRNVPLVVLSIDFTGRLLCLPLRDMYWHNNRIIDRRKCIFLDTYFFESEELFCQYN
jgi:hypothetical protein